MSLVLVKHLRYRLPLVWCEGRDINQSLHPFIVSRGNNRTGIRMTCNNDRPFRPRNHPLQGRRIIAQ